MVCRNSIPEAVMEARRTRELKELDERRKSNDRYWDSYFSRISNGYAIDREMLAHFMDIVNKNDEEIEWEEYFVKRPGWFLDPDDANPHKVKFFRKE